MELGNSFLKLQLIIVYQRASAYSLCFNSEVALFPEMFAGFLCSL